eukprot:5576872-Pyramimonas_sp.AAC.1
MVLLRVAGKCLERPLFVGWTLHGGRGVWRNSWKVDWQWCVGGCGGDSIGAETPWQHTIALCCAASWWQLLMAKAWLWFVPPLEVRY